MKKSSRPTIASVIWEKRPGELHIAQADVIEQLGYDHYFLRWNEQIHPTTTKILVQGPYGSLLPLVQQLHNWPGSSRPAFVYWFQQSLQILRFRRVNNLLSRIFSELCRHYLQPGRFLRRTSIGNSLISTTRGARLGYFGDILWLQENALLDLLVLSSTFYAEEFEELGVPSIVVPRGYHASYGADLSLDRDIAVVWMGKIRTKQRAKKLYWLKEELEKRNLTMHIYDGEKGNFIFGNQRTEILNRAYFVLNVFFSGPSDELSIRFFIAGANGAVVLTEPGINSYPFLTGKHLLECSVNKMPETISYYLNNLSEWQAISNNMSNLIRTELTLENSIATILRTSEQQLIRGMR